MERGRVADCLEERRGDKSFAWSLLHPPPTSESGGSDSSWLSFEYLTPGNNEGLFYVYRRSPHHARNIALQLDTKTLANSSQDKNARKRL
ncbi:hypothetical protein RRG08_058627 [Elysia crispata]|uniref:Uncharacterized protein n=1 Tax=Elysia crispata TaxID=231223 RepID=A0AAE0Z0K8_9GAST|nr:hypothetical protein RRG08_058627 [Elysia crispata]